MGRNFLLRIKKRPGASASGAVSALAGYKLWRMYRTNGIYLPTKHGFHRSIFRPSKTFCESLASCYPVAKSVHQTQPQKDVIRISVPFGKGRSSLFGARRILENLSFTHEDNKAQLILFQEHMLGEARGVFLTRETLGWTTIPVTVSHCNESRKNLALRMHRTMPLTEDTTMKIRVDGHVGENSSVSLCLEFPRFTFKQHPHLNKLVNGLKKHFENEAAIAINQQRHRNSRMSAFKRRR